jgi:hypothetical protein
MTVMVWAIQDLRKITIRKYAMNVVEMEYNGKGRQR